MNQKKVLCLSLLAVVLTAVICIYATNTYLSAQYTSAVSNSDFYGTYRSGDISTGVGGSVYLAIAPYETDDETAEFIIYDAADEPILTGTCELNEDGYATLYNGDDAYATLFFAREKYFYVENGQAAEVVTKISDAAMLP